MTPDRAAVYGVTVVVVLVALLSGPLGVGGLSASETGPPADAGNGTVAVSVESLPSDGVQFVERDSDVERYELVVTDAHVEIESVTGHPILLYELQIPEKGYGQTGVYFLDADDTGSKTLVMPDDSLPPDLVEESSYGGYLLVKTRTSSGDQVIVRQNVTVEVVA